MRRLYQRITRVGLVFLALANLTGCLEWVRAYQTYLQLDEFDRHFAITAQDGFTLHFKHPKLYSEDFVLLAKLRASNEQPEADGKLWHYVFRKVDMENRRITPEIQFFFDLRFNKLDKISSWTFSPMFLQIAPAEFLEASFRSLSGAEINEEKQQLKAKAELMEKISAQLPKKAKVVQNLGPPLEITEEEKQEIYYYRFLLDTQGIEPGYEDRAVSEVRLSFDKSSGELTKMSGRFAGLKIAINYRDYQETPEPEI